MKSELKLAPCTAPGLLSPIKSRSSFVRHQWSLIAIVVLTLTSCGGPGEATDKQAESSATSLQNPSDTSTTGLQQSQDNAAPQTDLAADEPKRQAETVVESEPVVEPDLVVDPEPVVGPEPVIEPEPVLELDPVVEPEPVVGPEPVVELEPVAESVPKDFKVFNALLYYGMPNFGERMAVIGEAEFFPGGMNRTDDSPTDAGISYAANQANWLETGFFQANAPIVALDIERWKTFPFAEGQSQLDSILKYRDTAIRFRAETGRDFCYYDVAPSAGTVFANWATTRPDIRLRWDAASDIVANELIPHVDALCPQLYTYYASSDQMLHQMYVESWETFAIETIAQARRIAGGKPVYPFVWPQYHEGGNVTGQPYIDAQIWRAQLELLKEHADGIIVWGGYQQNWNPNAPWWQTLQDVTGVTAY